MPALVKLNITLLAVLAVLGLVVLLLPDDESTVTVGLLEGSQLSELQRLDIERARKPVIELHKLGGQWWLLKPIKARARVARVDDLLELPNKYSHSQYPAHDLKLEEYGLAPPKVEIRFNDIPLQLGIINPISQRRYVLAKDTVHLISDDLFDVYTAEVESYVDLSLLSADSDIHSISVPQLHVARLSDGQWFDHINDEQVPQEIITRLLSAWQNAKALWIQNYQPAATADPVEISFASNQQERFVITQYDPDLVLAKPDFGIEYHLPAANAEQLFNLPQFVAEQEDYEH